MTVNIPFFHLLENIENGGTYTSGTHIKMRMRQKRQYKKEEKSVSFLI
jgi:hypothetical protein